MLPIIEGLTALVCRVGYTIVIYIHILESKSHYTLVLSTNR